MSAGEAHRARVRLRGSLEDLEAVHRAISRLAREAAVAESTTVPLRLALDELITNVVEHAFRGRSDPHLELDLRFEAGTLQATVEDNGPPFDPTVHPPVDTDAAVHERPIGGLGLHLVRRCVDEMHYLRAGERNRLTVAVRVSREPGP